MGKLSKDETIGYIYEKTSWEKPLLATKEALCYLIEVTMPAMRKNFEQFEGEHCDSQWKTTGYKEYNNQLYLLHSIEKQSSGLMKAVFAVKYIAPDWEYYVDRYDEENAANPMKISFGEWFISERELIMHDHEFFLERAAFYEHLIRKRRKEAMNR